MRDLRRKRSAAIIMLLNPLMMLSGAAAAAEPTYIVALGDSITHGEGVSLDEAFPAQLEKMLRADGFNVQVINAGVDGDTTDRMLMRMNTVIVPGTKIVIVQGGRNDFMSLQHSLSVEQSEANITNIVRQLRVQRLRAVLCGGPSRAALARDYGATLVSCSGDHHFVDGLHPDATGHRIIAGRLLAVIEGLLTETSSTPGAIPPQRNDARPPRPEPR
jgi:acyl-CoA thioesterase-1